MAENVLNVTDDNFEEEVLNSATPTLVDFWAEWCGPCRSMAPKIDELAQQYEGKIKVTKLNIDESPNTPGKYGVRGIPTLILFKDGEVVETLVGNQPPEKLKELIEKGL
ncbi:thioredoxin [Bdellovibrionota bacterium]